MSTLSVSDDRVQVLADSAEEQFGWQPELDCQLVAVSSASYSKDTDRFSATVATLRGSHEKKVPHLVMVDSTSDLVESLRFYDAIVVQLHPGDSAARTHVIAIQVIDELVRRGTLPEDALTLIAPAENNIFAETKRSDIIQRCQDLDIASGSRMVTAWDSISRMRRATEPILGYAIGELLGIGHDTPSEILALNAKGRAILRDTERTEIGVQLIDTAFRGVRSRLNVGEFLVDFRYFEALTSSQDGSPDSDARQRELFELMLRFAWAKAIDNDLGTRQLYNLAHRLVSSFDGVQSIADPQQHAS